jgi:hypothetical protein
MDPLVVITIIAIAALFVGNRVFGGAPRGQRRTVELGREIVCRLSPGQQLRKAADRNLVYQRIEEEARNRGETGPELFGNRIAAINRLPQAIRSSEHGMPGLER